eukprot:COSAG02_NODE_59501_length_274_cov_0.588571_1_plen_45_part_01
MTVILETAVLSGRLAASQAALLRTQATPSASSQRVHECCSIETLF